MEERKQSKSYRKRSGWWMKRGGALLLAFVLLCGQIMVPLAPVGAATPAAVDGGTFFVDTDNWGGGNSNSAADGDVDLRLNNSGNNKYPVEFKIPNVNKLPQKSAQLLVRALDVDEFTGNSGGEWDRVYFSSDEAKIALGNSYTPWPSSWANLSADYKKEMTADAYLGALSGQNDIWNTTVLNFEPKDFPKIAKGDNYVGITIHHNYQAGSPNTGWVMTVDWAQLIIDGGSRKAGEIDKAELKVEPGKVTIDTSFISKVPGKYSMEVNVIEKSKVNGKDVEENLGVSQKLFDIPQAGQSTNWDNIVIEDLGIDPSKEYVVNIILFEDRGNGRDKEKYTNAGEAQHVVTFSTHDPLVSDVAKSAYRSAPTAFTADDFKSKYFKINGGEPNGDKLESVKIVTLPDPAKGQLTFNGTAATPGQLIPVNDLDKLVFIPIAGGFDGTANFLWNGYNGTKYATEDARVTVNSSPEVKDIHKVMKAGDAELPFTNADDFAPNYVDPGNEQLDKVRIDTLPEPTKGKLVLVDPSGAETNVAAGQEIGATDLDRLKFIPEPNAAGTVDFKWSGSDGLQYSLEPKTVTVVINIPPVAGQVNKSGLIGQTVGFTAANFTSSPVYTDEDGDQLEKVKLSIPVDLASKGKLKYTSVTGAVYLDPGAEVTLNTVELNSLQFETSPALPEGSVVSIPWYGFDGMHFSDQPGSIHISYNGIPVAESFNVDAIEGTPLISIVLRGTDREGVTGITYGISTNPQIGTLVLDPSDPTGATWIYTPKADFKFGQDTFTYTVTDQDGNISVAPGAVTITLHKDLNGWTGNKDQGNTDVVRAVPNQPLKMSAVSSIAAEGVTATVDGTTIPLTLSNPTTWAVDGFKKWESNDYIVPASSIGGQHNVTYAAVNAAGVVVQTEAADKLADNHFQVASSSLTLTANPAKILGDGKSSTVLTAKLVDENGNPLKGVEVVFSAPTNTGQFVGTNKAVTNAEGIAQVTYQSAQITGVAPQNISLKANVNDTKLGLVAEKDVTITFMPASIKGVVTSGNDSKPVAGASVRVTLDMDGDGVITPGVDFDETVVTDQNGAYSVIVPKGDAVYDLTVTQNVMIGGVSTPVSYKQTAQVGEVTGAGNQSFDSDRTVTGIVLFKEPNGSTSVLTQDVLSKSSVYLKKKDGTYVSNNGVPTAYPLQGQGVFNAKGIAVGEYELEVRYEAAPGQSIMISRSPIQVTASGEINISTELIDPYGTITDAVTNKVIEGAKVTLQYANTPRNIGKGLVPGQGVTLPAIPGFAPNDNASPVQLSDVNGFYAYMVYPETDYVLVVTKDGYESYMSPVLSVEREIVRHDLKLKPIQSNNNNSGSSSNTGGWTPTPDKETKLALQIEADKNKVKEGEKSHLTVTYSNQSASATVSGEVRVTLPEGVVVVDAAGGVVIGNTIVWKITNVAAGKGGSFKPVIQWPQAKAADTVFDITGEMIANGTTGTNGANDAKAKAAIKVNVFSDRFGELKHYRYIIGFPDKEFKPNGSLTRAELAAIVSRLTIDAVSDDKPMYKDVRSGHWATKHINIATKYGYFSGYKDNTFRPDAPVTRGELASVMARFLKLEVNKPVSNHFSDTSKHWAGSTIEALYNGKYLRGYEDGTFKPSQNIKRVEAVMMINRMLYRGPLKGLDPMFPDMPTTHWGYGDVQEATVSHDSTRNTDGSETWTRTISNQAK